MLKGEESPPGQLLLARRQFNSRKWSGCHETIEEFGIDCLKRVSDVRLWVDVPAFIAESECVHVALAELGKDRMEPLESATIPQIKTVSAYRHSSPSEE